MRLVLLAILLLVIAIVAIALLRRRLARSTMRGRLSIRDREAWQQKWTDLEELLKGGESHWHVAVIEADKLFDQVLRATGAYGESMGERLKFVTSSRPDRQYLWDAHLVRNKLAHEAHYKLTKRTAQMVIANFKKGLREFGVL